MSISFKDRVAIVTGAGGGLGRAYAIELARRGARVVVNDLGGARDGTGHSDAALKVVEEIRSEGGEAMSNGGNVAEYEQMVEMAAKTKEAWGGIHILINNAGILRDKTFHNMTPELLDPLLDVHLKGAFYVTQPAWIKMREQGYGRVVNTTSGSGLFGNFGQSNYAAAKLGLVGLTRVLANEGAKHNIKANAIAPIAYTRMTEELMTGMEEKLNPEYVSPLVAWLVHEDCPVSGEVYTVAGGYIARVFIGVTPGVIQKDLTPEKVRDAFDKIRDETGYYVPIEPGEEMSRVFPNL